MEKMPRQTEVASPKRSITRKIWGLLPTLMIVLLVGVIVLLGNQIKTKGNVIKEEQAASLRTERPPQRM